MSEYEQLSDAEKRALDLDILTVVRTLDESEGRKRVQWTANLAVVVTAIAARP